MQSNRSLQRTIIKPLLLLLAVFFCIPALAQSNMEEFRQMYKKACSGDANAQYNLADAYLSSKYFPEGYYIPRDGETAYYWAYEALKNGCKKAKVLLGDSYAMMQDTTLAIKCYEEAAAEGNTDAILTLGLVYSDKKDFDKAISWYEKGDKKGDNVCTFELADVYFWDKEDYNSAFPLYKKAHESGHDKAKLMLGYCYLYGYGTDQDLDLAKKYLNKAAESGYDMALHLIEFNIPIEQSRNSK